MADMKKVYEDLIIINLYTLLYVVSFLFSILWSETASKYLLGSKTDCM